jgi:hypothetical protein
MKFADEKYQQVLEELAKAQNMSEENVMRAALRVYQLVHENNKRGLSLSFVDSTGQVVSDRMSIMPNID